MTYLLTKHSNNHIELTINGKIHSDDMNRLLDEWVQATVSMVQADPNTELQNATLLYRIDSFAMPSFSAVMDEMRRMPELWATMKYFGKMAVISEQQWLQKVAEIEGWMIPNLDIKGFNPDEESAAKVWLGLQG
ncbi:MULTISPECIES: SpoIIAA family protein [unclassified Psychrobacter]|uniref:STAS/SEC14 domain-containing protein n=1 Tax=unclassified Psychrobacter TaxID=196806 RepID=UPI003F48841D